MNRIKIENNGCYATTIEHKLGCNYNAINSNNENRINAVTAIAAISRGKDESKNPKKRFDSLCVEAAPDLSYNSILSLANNNTKIDRGVAGRPLEFCPIVMDVVKHKDGLVFTKSNIEIFLPNDLTNNSALDIVNKLLPYSYLTNNKLYTNLRAVYNYLGSSALEIYNNPSDFKDNPYFIVEVNAPYFVFAQIRTHGALSQVAVSERVTSEDEVWLPDDFIDRVRDKSFDIYVKLDLPFNADRNLILEKMKKADLFTIKEIFISLGYKKEIFNRWYNHMKFKRFIIGGYINNPKQWGHFLLEREAFPNIYKSWVQPETKQIATFINYLINKYLNNEGGNNVKN